MMSAMRADTTSSRRRRHITRDDDEQEATEIVDPASREGASVVVEQPEIPDRRRNDDDTSSSTTKLLYTHRFSLLIFILVLIFAVIGTPEEKLLFTTTSAKKNKNRVGVANQKLTMIDDRRVNQTEETASARLQQQLVTETQILRSSETGGLLGFYKNSTFCEEIRPNNNHVKSNPPFQIVVGAYAYETREGGVNFEDNYLEDLGLTNTHIYWYRKEFPEEAAVRVAIPKKCNVTLHEVVLSRNTGQESVALVDHIVKYYNDTSTKGAVAFLHGHLARAWHVTCEQVFGTMVAYYRQMLVLRDYYDDDDSMPMITLTDLIFREGRRRRRRRLQQRNTTNFDCQKVFARYNLTTYSEKGIPGYWGCCTNAIIPWSRIRQYPKEFYQDWFRVLLDVTYDDHDKTRYCFEYQLWPLFRGNDTAEARCTIMRDAELILSHLEQRLARCRGVIGGQGGYGVRARAKPGYIPLPKECRE